MMPIMARLVTIKNDPTQCQKLLVDSLSANASQAPIAAKASGGTQPNRIARRLGFSQISRIESCPSSQCSESFTADQAHPEWLHRQQENCSRSAVFWRRCHLSF